MAAHIERRGLARTLADLDPCQPLVDEITACDDPIRRQHLQAELMAKREASAKMARQELVRFLLPHLDAYDIQRDHPDRWLMLAHSVIMLDRGR